MTRRGRRSPAADSFLDRDGATGSDRAVAGSGSGRRFHFHPIFFYALAPPLARRRPLHHREIVLARQVKKLRSDHHRGLLVGAVVGPATAGRAPEPERPVRGLVAFDQVVHRRFAVLRPIFGARMRNNWRNSSSLGSIASILWGIGVETLVDQVRGSRFVGR